MSASSELVRRCDAFAKRQGISRAHASTIIFNDGKRIDAIVNGAGITVKRLEQVLRRLGQLERGEIPAKRVPRRSPQTAEGGITALSGNEA